MAAEKDALPDMTWFEFEVLSQLIGKRMYGNEILSVLNQRFGKDSVSSGKLYPTLQKLERKGFIERTKDPDVEDGKGVSRGVERVYLSITPTGVDELEKATTYSTKAFIQAQLLRLQKELAREFHRYITEFLGTDIRCGIAKICLDTGLEEIISEIDKDQEVTYYYLELPFRDQLLPEECQWEGSAAMSHLPARPTDLPLKDGFLDAFVIGLVLHDLEEWGPFLEEVARTVRKDGIISVVDFARFDSYILEALMSNFHKPWKDEEKLLGLDPDIVREALAPHAKDIVTERVKEFLLVHGRRK